MIILHPSVNRMLKEYCSSSQKLSASRPSTCQHLLISVKKPSGGRAVSKWHDQAQDGQEGEGSGPSALWLLALQPGDSQQLAAHSQRPQEGRQLGLRVASEARLFVGLASVWPMRLHWHVDAVAQPLLSSCHLHIQVLLFLMAYMASCRTFIP